MYENKIMKPVKNYPKKGGGGTKMSNRGGECHQSTFYACMEIAQ
jgi:hypothetical protein